MRTSFFLIAAITFTITSANAAVKIDKVLPFTPEADSVRIAVTATGKGELTGTITPAGKKDVVWKGSLGSIGADGQVEKRLEKLKVEPWSPGSPRLYELTVAGEGASVTVRFGFRKFESKNGNFYLNGKPIFLRGLAIGPPGRGVPEATAFTRQFAYDYVSYLKKQNVNLIRVNEDSQDWFDVCDELGMMCDQGFYASPPSGLTKEQEALEAEKDKKEGKAPEDDPETVAPLAGPAAVWNSLTGKKLPKDFDLSHRTYLARFETYVRHPSIVIYILSNEMPFAGKRGDEVHEYLQKMYERLAKWDHTRLYIGNAGYGQGREADVNDVHRYWGWYYNSFLTYFNIRDPKLFGDYKKDQPLTFSECIGNFTGPNGAYNVIERKQIAAQLCWTGYSPNQVEDAQAYQGFMNKQGIETFRRLREQNSRVSGLMPFTIAFRNWRGITSFSQMIPTAAAKQFGISYSPVLLSFEHWQPQLYAGAETTVRAHIVNDADDFSDLRGATLSWVLWGSEQKPAATGTIDLPNVPYYAASVKPLKLKLPDNLRTGEYKLMGTILKDRKEIATNEIPIFVAGTEYKQTAKDLKRNVLVYDPNGKTADAMKALKINVENITKLDKLSPANDLLVIGERAWDARLTADKAKLAEFVRAGGRVLCLGQLHDKFDATWLSAQIKMATVSANDSDYTPKERPSFDQMAINPEIPGHPIFNSLSRERLKFWSDTSDWDQTKKGFPEIYPIRYGFVLTKQEDLGHVAILADYDRGLEGVALAEMFDGKGSTLMCALELVPRAGVDPVADRMLTNLVQFMASDVPHPIHRLADGPIRWGDYPSMQGFLSGPVQGFFINTVWVKPPTDPAATPISNDKGWWNSRPSDQFVPRGIRPRGPFGYTTNCTPREADKSENGAGIFWAAVPAGRKTVESQIENPTEKAASIEVQVNNGTVVKIEVPPGQTATLRAPLNAYAEGDVSVRYTGNKKLVILETAFR